MAFLARALSMCGSWVRNWWTLRTTGRILVQEVPGVSPAHKRGVVALYLAPGDQQEGAGIIGIQGSLQDAGHPGEEAGMPLADGRCTVFRQVNDKQGRTLQVPFRHPDIILLVACRKFPVDEPCIVA